jgi:hypothetical protein
MNLFGVGKDRWSASIAVEHEVQITNAVYLIQKLRVFHPQIETAEFYNHEGYHGVV